MEHGLPQRSCLPRLLPEPSASSTGPLSPWRSPPLITTQRQPVIRATDPRTSQSCQDLTNVCPWSTRYSLFFVTIIRASISIPDKAPRLRSLRCLPSSRHQHPTPSSLTGATGARILSRGAAISQGSRHWRRLLRLALTQSQQNR